MPGTTITMATMMDTRTSTKDHVNRTTDSRALLRIMTLLSPSFPIGAFVYSAGLESAVASGALKKPDDFQCWIATSLTQGSAKNDVIICASAWRKGSIEKELCDLCLSLASGKERYEEQIELGAAFIDAANAWTQEGQTLPSCPCPLPVAVGVVAQKNNIGLPEILTGYLHAFASNQVQAALRLGCFGQNDGLNILSNLEAVIIEAAEFAHSADLSALGTSTLFADLLSLHHETLEPRIFRS